MPDKEIPPMPPEAMEDMVKFFAKMRAALDIAAGAIENGNYPLLMVSLAQVTNGTNRVGEAFSRTTTMNQMPDALREFYEQVAQRGIPIPNNLDEIVEEVRVLYGG